MIGNEIVEWGLIGNSSIDKYSFAPVMWTSLFRYLGLPVIYKVIHTDDIYLLQKQYDEEIVKMGAMGFNVAMPWKNWAFAQCDWTSASLKRNRTVNTIFKRQRAVFCSNTDAFDIELNASHAAVMKDAVLEYYLKKQEVAQY